MNVAPPRRTTRYTGRWPLLAATAVPLLLAAGCASNVAPPRLYQLRSAPPATAQPVPTGEVVQLLLPVELLQTHS